MMTLPRNDLAERGVISAVLLDQRAALARIKFLNAEMFSTATHQKIFRAMQTLAAADNPISISGIYDLATDRPMNAELSGYLLDVLQAVTTSAAIVHDAELVRTAWIRRELITNAHALIRVAEEGKPLSECDTLVERMRGLLQNKPVVAISEKSYRGVPGVGSRY